MVGQTRLNLIAIRCAAPVLLVGGLFVLPVAAAQPPPAAVAMFEYSYSPKTVTVPAGTAVTWRNTGREAHTASLDGVFDTGAVAPGAEASFTFANPGTFRYVCRFHGGPTGAGMNGTVIVTPPAGTPEQPLPEVGAKAARDLVLPLVASGLLLLGLALRVMR